MTRTKSNSGTATKQKLRTARSSYSNFKKEYEFSRHLSKEQIKVIDDHVPNHMDKAVWERDTSAHVRGDKAIEMCIFDTMDKLLALYSVQPSTYVRILFNLCYAKSQEGFMNNAIMEYERGVRAIRKVIPAYIAVKENLQIGLKLDPKMTEYQSSLKPREYLMLCSYVDRILNRIVELWGPPQSKKYRYPIKYYIPEIDHELEVSMSQLDTLILHSILDYVFSTMKQKDGRLKNEALTLIGHLLVFWGFEKRDSYYDVGIRMRDQWNVYRRRMRIVRAKADKLDKLFILTDVPLAVPSDSISFDPKNNRFIVPISKILPSVRVTLRKP